MFYKSEIEYPKFNNKNELYFEKLIKLEKLSILLSFYSKFFTKLLENNTYFNTFIQFYSNKVSKQIFDQFILLL